MPLTAISSTGYLVDNFNSKIQNIFDKIAPLKTKYVKYPKAPCLKKWSGHQKLKEKVSSGRATVEKKTRLQVHNDIYKDKLNEYNQAIKQARHSLFSKIINENMNNSKELFPTVDRLVNSPSTIPSEMLSSEKCVQCASFFNNKIITVRQNISALKSTTELALPFSRNSTCVMSLLKKNNLDHVSLQITGPSPTYHSLAKYLKKQYTFSSRIILHPIAF